MLRPAALLPAGLLLLLSLAIAAPALAKEGMQARLDAPIPADTPPGTTIQVGWTTFTVDGQGGRVAFSGAPVFIALRSPGAAAPESVVFGDEYPSGSGHFSASIVVPAGGIAPDGVTIGLRGESCVDGQCGRSDLPFELVGPVLSAAAVPPAASAAVGTSPAPVPRSTPEGTSGPERDTIPWAALAVGGAAIVVAVVLIGRRIGRRRAAIAISGTLTALVVLLAAAGGALGKEEGVLVTLDTPMPDEPTPGTSIELGWSMRIEPVDGSAATTPYETTALLVRVTSRSGVPIDVPATHLGGGRYTARIVVPEAGLGALDMGIPSESGRLLLLAEVFDAPPRIRTVGPDAGGASAVGGPLPWLLVGIAALATAVGAGAAVVVRRRRSGHPTTLAIE